MESKAMYCAEQIQIPRELGAVMKAYTKAVILADPTDLNRWSANYFAEMAGRPLPFPNLENERRDGAAPATRSQPPSTQATPRTAEQVPVAAPAAASAPALAPIEEQASAPAPEAVPTPSEGSPQYEGESAAATPMMEGADEAAGANADLAVAEAVQQQVDELAGRGDYEAGLSLLNEAVQQQPQNAELLFRRGHYYHHIIQNGDAALTDYNGCLALDDQNADAYCGRADLLHYGSENPGEALADYTKAVELGRTDPDTLTQRAVLYKTLNMAEEAMRDSADALEQSPDHMDAIRARADVYNFLLDDVENALADYNTVLSGECEDADVFVARGELLRRAGMYEEALRDFEAAVGLDETNQEAQEQLASLQAELGEE